jgi:hypothetical protein
MDTHISAHAFFKLTYLIGYVQSCRDMTPENRGWFDRLCELADELEVEIKDDRRL